MDYDCDNYVYFLSNNFLNINDDKNNIFNNLNKTHKIKYKLSKDDKDYIKDLVKLLIDNECDVKTKTIERMYNNFKHFIEKKKEEYPNAKEIVMIGGADEDRLVSMTLPGRNRNNRTRIYNLTADFAMFIVFCMSIFCIILSYVRLHNSGIYGSISSVFTSMPAESLYRLIPERFRYMLDINDVPSFFTILFNWTNNILTTRREELSEIGEHLYREVTGYCQEGLLSDPDTWFGMLDMYGEMVRSMLNNRDLSRCNINIARHIADMNLERLGNNIDYIQMYLNWGRVMGASSLIYFTRRIYNSYLRNIDDEEFIPLGLTSRSNSMYEENSYTPPRRGRSGSISSNNSTRRGNDSVTSMYEENSYTSPRRGRSGSISSNNSTRRRSDSVNSRSLIRRDLNGGKKRKGKKTKKNKSRK